MRYFRHAGEVFGYDSDQLVFIDQIIAAGAVEVTGSWPPALTMTPAELLAAKLQEINARCESEIAAISAGYPASEVLSWPKQESEARAFAADAGAVTPLLDALAAARGIPKAELAARVIAKADLFAQFSGQIIGKRQALEDAINALPADANAADIDAIRWEA